MAHHYSNIGLRHSDGSGKGVRRHVSATISRIFPDRYDHDGAEHQHVWIKQLQALDGGDNYDVDVFVAIRVTEGGIGRDIPFQDNTPVEMQGMFIPADQAYAGQDNQNLPVLHFTHAPVGFVIYNAVEYK